MKQQSLIDKLIKATGLRIEPWDVAAVTDATRLIIFTVQSSIEDAVVDEPHMRRVVREALEDAGLKNVGVLFLQGMDVTVVNDAPPR